LEATIFHKGSFQLSATNAEAFVAAILSPFQGFVIPAFTHGLRRGLHSSLLRGYATLVVNGRSPVDDS
jgi:hypothetical protein